LAREAATNLAKAMAEANAFHLPDARERYRERLTRAIECARGALSAERAGSDDAVGAHLTLVSALAARAEDARHGAGQLSRSAQRAPTTRDCDEGWRRVESIVVTAEEAADEAVRVATELGDAGTREHARTAEAAAHAARQIVDERNDAYTFHTDPGFSFGEGWYLAAAAVLEGVTIQIEPDQPQTTQAERFLRDAGLGGNVAPYRTRPRANKHLTEIVARRFRTDPMLAQRKLRVAFLGKAPGSPAVVEWTEAALAGVDRGPKVLLWVRYCAHHPTRNTTYDELVELVQRTLSAGLVPVLIGDAVRDGLLPAGAVDLTLFWKEPTFQGTDMRRAQLQLFEHLRRTHARVGQVGVTTAGMDGPALMGLPTMYINEAPNVRMGQWVGVVPGYQEIVRDQDYLERISDGLERWRRTFTRIP